MKEEFIICGCHGEGYMFTWYEKDDIPALYISLWKEGIGHYDHNWRHRLRHIWQIIRTGEVYTDQLILEEKQVVKLIDVCQTFLREHPYIESQN